MFNHAQIFNDVERSTAYQVQKTLNKAGIAKFLNNKCIEVE